MARLSPAKQAQLDQLNAEANEPDDAPRHSLKEILHQIVGTIGREHLHDSIDALPESVHGDDVEKDEAEDENDDDSAEVEGPNPAPKEL